MSSRALLALAGVLAAMAGLAAADAPEQQPSYTTFRMVRTRNIFDPDRRPFELVSRPVAPPPPPPVAPADYVALTGTLVTGDKAFAFFTGSRSEFNAVVALSGTVANMKVTKITPANVEVDRGGKPVIIAVGQQLALNSSTPVATVVMPVSEATPAPDTGQPSGQENLIRRMMERRQKEISK